MPAEEFLNGCMRLRGTARSKDLTLMMFEHKRFQRKMSKQNRTLEKKLDSIGACVGGVGLAMGDIL